MLQASDAVAGFHERAIIHDHRGKRAQLLGDWASKIETPSGDQRDLDPGLHRVCDRAAVGFGNLEGAVEKRAVNINRDEANRHPDIVTCGAAARNSTAPRGCEYGTEAACMRLRTAIQRLC